MIVLGLDLSKNRTGYAVDGLHGACPPRTGVWKPYGGGELLGRAGHEFQSWLFRMIGMWNVEMIAYEAPPAGNTGGDIIMTFDETMMLFGMAFSVHIICEARKISPPRKVSVQTVRKHFVGHGRPPNPKKVVKQRCRALGWTPANEDESDAAAVWAWAKATLDPAFKLETGPLFAAVQAARSIA